MVETHRAVPPVMLDAWERATQGPDPIAALGATKALWQHLAQWQSVLVTEAVNATATWDDIGLALGTTRQAAWARFRKGVERAEELGQCQNRSVRQASKQSRR